MSLTLDAIVQRAHTHRGEKIDIGKFRDFKFQVRGYYLYLQQFQEDRDYHASFGVSLQPLTRHGLEVALPIDAKLSVKAIESMMNTARTHL